MRLNIRNKLLLPIIGIVGSIMFASSLITTSIVEKQLTATYEAELNVVSNALAKNVKNTTTGYKRDVRTLAALDILRTTAMALEEGDEAKIDAALTAADIGMKKFVAIYSHFPVISIARADGLVVGGTNPETFGKVNVAQHGYFQAAMRGEVTFSAPLVSMDTKDKAVVVGTPVYGKSLTKPAAVLYTTLPCKAISDNIIQDINIGSTGFAYLVDPGGLMLAHPDFTTVQKFNA